MARNRFALFSCFAFVLSLYPVKSEAQALPPPAEVDRVVVDLGTIKSTGFSRTISVSTSRPNASLTLTKVTVLQQGSNITATIQPPTQVTPLTPVFVTLSGQNLSPVSDIGAKIVLSLKNTGPAFPDLPTNGDFRLSVLLRGTAICDPTQASCNLPGPYCTIDKINEPHIFVAVPNFESQAWGAVEPHLREHNNAFLKYQRPLRFLIDNLGLSQYLTKDTTACKNTCPAACCQCSTNCSPQIQFTKPANRSPEAVFSWSDNSPAEFAGVMNGYNFSITVPKSITGFVTLGPSHSEFFFDEPMPRISIQDSTSKVLLDEQVSCMNISTFESIVRSPAAKSDFPYVNLRFGQP